MEIRAAEISDIIKKQIQDFVDDLQENVTWDEAQYRLMVQAKVAAGPRARSAP